MVDDCLAVSHRDCGTSELHALLAAYALLGVYLEGRIVLHVFQQRARSARDDNGSLVCCELLLYRCLGLRKLVRVSHADALDADSLAELLKVDCRRRVALEVLACCRVLLVTCHARDGVVEYDNSGIRVVVCDVDKTCHAAVHERGIADNCNCLVLGLSSASLVEAVESRDRSSHADCGVDSVERRGSSESVAADIARYRNAELLQAVEQSAVRTSGAHYRRSYRDILVESRKVLLLAEELLCDDGLRELAYVAEYLLALDVVHADVAAVRLDYAVELLNDVYLLVLGGEVLYQLLGERVHHAELQHGSLLAERLLDVLVSGAVGDNAEFCLVGYLDPVEGSRLCVLDELLCALLDEYVSALCICGHHYEFLRCFLVGLEVELLSVLHFNYALRMCNACGHSHDERSVVLLGELECELDEFFALGRIRGLEHGHLRRDSVVAAVLLIL